MKILGLTSNPKVSKIKPVVPNKPPVRPPVPLKEYLNRAYQKVKGENRLGLDLALGLEGCVPISIFLQGIPGTAHEYAGVSDKFAENEPEVPLDEQECYSGSLPKVAAMFAAFKLRAEARELVSEVKSGRVQIIGTTEPKRVSNFFAKLKANINPDLDASDVAKFIRGQPGKINKDPKSAEIVSVTGTFSDPSTLGVEFTSDFKGHMSAMIVHSDNCSAGECIARLSYPYINAKLVDAGFLVFDKAHPRQAKGIWLCGDYIVTSGDFPCANTDKSQAFVRIDTVNDCNKVTHNCRSAQNTTSFQVARFFLEILLGEFVESGKFVDKESCKEMRELLQVSRSSHLDPAAFPADFNIDAVKIGDGQLKENAGRADTVVYSEGMLISWLHIMPNPTNPDDIPFNEELKKRFDKYGFTGKAAICYQNLSRHQHTTGLVEIIHTAISEYINQ